MKVEIIMFPIIALALILMIIALDWGYKTFGEEFKFNMTDDLMEEERQLMLCIEWHIQNPKCSMLVGSIDNSNGEPEK